MHNLSCENEFDFQDNELERKSQSVDMKGCAPRLLLKQREKQLGHGLFNAKNSPEVLYAAEILLRDFSRIFVCYAVCNF